MSDDQPPADEPVQPEIKVRESVFPAGHTFPNALLEEWLAIPAEEPLYIGPLPRAIWDQFLFSMSDIVTSIAELRMSLIDFSNGRIEAADKHLLNSTSLLTDGEARHRMLFDALIRSAIEVRKNAGK